MNRVGSFWRLGLLVALNVALAAPALGQESDALLELVTATMPSNRVTVAMPLLANDSHDAALDYGRFALASVLGPYLGEAKALRLIPQSSLSYGLAQLGKKPGDPLGTNDAARLGEMIEARRVVWGSYSREGDKWRVSVQMLNVSDGGVSKTLTASSTDWFVIRDDLGKQILKELRIVPEKGERRKMLPRWTKSDSTLEWLAKARMALEDHRSAGEWEGYARRASEADPRCAEALAAWALSEVSQGKTAPGLARVRKAIELKPDLASAHAILGHASMMQERTVEAEDSLKQAALLDPDSPSRLGRLAEYYLITKDTANAIEWFTKAIKLGPFQSSLHANLGRALLVTGKREAALAEMKEAERLDFEPDLNTEEYLSWGYARLSDAPSAIAHYEKAVTLARQVGLDPKRVKTLERERDDLKASLTPSYISTSPPRDFTAESFAEALRARLTSDETAAVIRPLTSTSEMDDRARELTRGGTNDLVKAKLLFESLTGHLDVGEGALRTAPEAFAAWNGPEAAFRCQEYALLYLMLARAIGLRAYFVDVRRAYDGEYVSHACAAVFVGEKALLVDPSYRWFGVPHKEFSVMDDLQTTAEYLSQVRDLRVRRIAAKLQPESAYAQFNLATRLLAEEKWDEARKQMATVARLDSTGRLTNALNAMLSYHDQKFEETIAFAEKALALGFPSKTALLHLLLANSYYDLGRFSESREELRKVLRCGPDEKQARAARRRIAKINEMTGSD